MKQEIFEDTIQFPAGGGEMGDLIRAKDWSKTSLGNPSDWPQSLRTTLSILLNSKFPMFLFWGPELICFYNDAYRPSLGKNGKHPDILGAKGKEAWTEIWDIIKPLINQVLAGGEASWSEDQLIPIYRNGSIEDVYWTFSYSPVNDESGKPAGVFVTCSETTDKVTTNKKLEESNNQLQFAIEAAELATFDYDPLSGKFTSNERLKDWFGLPPQTEIELQHAISAIAEKDRHRVTEAITKSLQFSSGGSYDIEYTIVNPATKKETIVRAKGQTKFNENNIAIRFNGTLEDVTEQALARKKIKESEQIFQAAIQAVQGILWTNNALGEMEGEQSGWAALTGQSYEEYQGFGWSKAIHKDDAEATVNAWNEAVQERKTFIFEHRVKLKDNNWGYFSIHAIPLQNADGSIREWVGVHTDITERKISEKLLKQNEEKLNIVINASEMGTYQLNLKTDEIVCSERFLQIFGYQDSATLNHREFIGQLHKDDIDIRNEAFKKALNTGILNYQSRIIWNDTSIHWINIKGKVFYDERNKPATLIGTAMDVTEEKNYQQVLMESEQKFRLLADSMPQFIWTAGADGNLNYFNQAVYNYSGLSAEQVHSEGWLQIVHPDERKENITQWIHSVTTGNDFIFEHRFKRYDGEYRWQLSRAVPQKDAYGAIQMWVGTSTDIQEIKEQDEQKDYFIGMVSHELKTPFTTIKGYIQLLLTKYADTEDTFLKNSLTIVERQIEKNIKLITELLDISKIKAGSLYLNDEYFLINTLVHEVADDVKNVNPRYNFIFENETEGYVYADKDRIGQVLINLITNAVKYSPHSKEVKINIEADDTNIVVSIQDFGIGINKTDQKKIFERFYRVEGKNESRFAGFGIGLFIASEIIQKYQGKISVKSEPGKGSVFSFSLPLKNNNE